MGETPQKMLDRVLAAKQAYRRKLALLPFEEKILMVLQMQRVSRSAEAGATKALRYATTAEHGIRRRIADNRETLRVAFLL